MNCVIRELYFKFLRNSHAKKHLESQHGRLISIYMFHRQCDKWYVTLYTSYANLHKKPLFLCIASDKV